MFAPKSAAAGSGCAIGRPRSPAPERGVAALLLAALTALVSPVGTASAADAHLSRPERGKAGRPASITVSYAELIEDDAVTRTGRRLGDAVRDPRTPRAHLQPFLEGYSSLLPHVVGMVFGADPLPRREILERWPAGTQQPAWVALFRGGRYRAVADGAGGVTLFLPGDEAGAAWRKHYPVVRHGLAALAGGGVSPLAVKVFAYRNDYRRQELHLDLRPVTVTAASFPPDRASLDLHSLEDFFGKGGRLEGAQLDRDEGLVLYASPDHRDTLAGEPVSLADFAVAYRAVFHAGDNDAFISLDPHADPSLVSVNFGGYLEDTRLGASVLAADRLFKTISSGLDAISFRDARPEIRSRLPTFLTNAERGFLEGGQSPPGAWLSIRSWFYPESISVDSDPDEGIAVITRPQFTAAAERTAGGFGSAGPRRKEAALPADIRASIRDINANYARYAAAFAEIGDLATVARLMAVSIWLQRSDASWLDLDALLAVELPAAATPRTLEQIISAEYIAVLPSERITEETVRRRSEVTWMTPMLRRTIADFFGNPKTFAGYLCATRKAQRRPCSAYEGEAESFFRARGGDQLRSLFRSNEDLLAFLEYLAPRLEFPPPPEVGAAQAEELADRRRSASLGVELAAAEARLAAAPESSAEFAAAREEKERIEAELAAIMKRYHGGAPRASAWKTKSVIHVNGGISLRPHEFSIRSSSASPALRRFKQLAKGAAVDGGAGGGKGRLVRSRAGRPAPPVAGAAPGMPQGRGGGRGAPPGKAASPPPVAARAPAAAPSQSPRAPAAKAAVPQPAPQQPAAAGPVGATPPIVKSVSIPAAAAGSARIVGELVADGRIVFRKAAP
jgi:hypothetical protein